MSALLATIHRHRQALFALLMIAIVLLLLWTARGALPAFFIGLALAFILDPAVTFLARRGDAALGRRHRHVRGRGGGGLGARSPSLCRRSAARRASSSTHCPLGAVGDFERGLAEWYEGLPLPDELREIDRRAAGGHRRGHRRPPARPPGADDQRHRAGRHLRARPHRRPGLAVLRAQGPRGLPASGRRRHAAGLARRRREPPRPARPRRRPMGARPAAAGRLDLRWPPPSASPS